MFGGKRSQDDFSDELRAHLQLEIDRLRSEGLSEEEAYWTARRALGNLSAAGERFYDRSHWLWLEHMFQDIRHALRRLRHSPVFALTTILTLALGIGATTSIFTLVHAVLLQSLAVSNPQQLYRIGKHPHCCIWAGITNTRNSPFSRSSCTVTSAIIPIIFRSWRPSRPAERMWGRGASIAPSPRILTGPICVRELLRHVRRERIPRTHNYQQRRPRRIPPVAMMSYRLWQKQYARDPSVIGSVFNLDNEPFTIVGITPPPFYGDSLRYVPPDFFLPLATNRSCRATARC